MDVISRTLFSFVVVFKTVNVIDTQNKATFSVGQLLVQIRRCTFCAWTCNGVEIIFTKRFWNLKASSIWRDSFRSSLPTEDDNITFLTCEAQSANSENVCAWVIKPRYCGDVNVTFIKQKSVRKCFQYPNQ